MTAAGTTSLLAAARALAPLIAQHADAAERDRRAQMPVVDAMANAGIFHMLVPRALGGSELHPAELLAVLEALSIADASTGWVAMIGATSAITSAYVAEDAAREVFGSGPGARIAGIVNPRGVATPTDAGYTVSGRWAFASGCQHSDWIALACMVKSPDGAMQDVRFVTVPMSQVEVIDTWDVAGLRGTGSHDVAVTDVAVPSGRTYSLVSDKPVHPGSLYSFSIFGLLSVAVAAVALGAGRAALDEFKQLAPTKVPFGRRRPVSEWSLAQSELAQAEAALRSGRAFLLQTIGDMWDTLERGDEPSVEQRALVRLSATTAVQGAVRAVDAAYNTAGGSSIYSTSLLQRRFRDIHTLTQHVMVGQSSLEAAGRALLGLSVPPGFL